MLLVTVCKGYPSLEFNRDNVYYITKPFKPEELVESVEKFLAKIEMK